jgi:predicted PurR-regulated permease PerM
MAKEPEPSSELPPEPEASVAPPPGPAEVCPTPAPEEKAALPTHFARLFFGAVTLLVLYFTYLIIKPYLIDIFLALVLFFTFKPLYRLITRALWGLQALASGLTCLFLALLICIPLFSLVSIIANQALEFSSVVGKGLQSGHLWPWVSAKISAVQEYLVHLNLPLPPEQIKLEQTVQTILKQASQFIYANAIGLIKGFTTFFLDLILVLFITFFLFLQGDDFIEEIKKLSPLEAGHNEEILQEMEKTIKATLRGTVVVALVQGILGGVGFLLFGVPQAAFWGTLMVPAAVIPLVGSALIWVPAALYLFFQGALAKALGLFLFCLVFIGSVENLLKPLLMKGTRSTPSIFILFSILGGIAYFGMIGFILGPLILSFLLSLLRIYERAILAPSPVPGAARPEITRPIPPKEDGS